MKQQLIQLRQLTQLKQLVQLIELKHLKRLFKQLLSLSRLTLIVGSLLGLGCLGFITTATAAIAETDVKTTPATTSTTASNSTTTAASQDGMTSSALSQGLMLAAFALIFYFLVLRPQSKRAKDHRNLISNIQKGDEILTSGGIVGRVAKITDDFIVLNISDNNEILIQRQAVAALLPKGTMKSI